MTDIGDRLLVIRDHLRTGAVGQREVWEEWLAEAADELDQLFWSKAALQTEIERLRALDDEKWTKHLLEREELKAEVERLNIRIHQDAEAALSHLNEIDRLREILDGTERREAEYLALIEQRTAERDVWKIACDAQAEKVTQLKAERHTTKMMLHDILDKHVPKKPVD